MHDQVAKIRGASGLADMSVTPRGTKGAAAVEIVDASGNQLTSFVPPALVTTAYDYIAVTSSNSNGDPLIIQYRSGGAAGTLVATLTLTYDASFNFVSVTKT